MNQIKVFTYNDLPEPPFDGKYRVIDEKLIEYLVKIVRRTIENREFIRYMKKEMDIGRCAFYKDYDMKNGFTIELHHAPLTLYDITYAVAIKIFKASDNKEPFIYPYQVVDEVNYLHFNGLVGLVPLNPTAHELVHDDMLDLHPQMIVGRYKEFYSMYKPYMTDESKMKIKEFNDLESKDPNTIPSILKYKPIMIKNSKFKSLGNLKLQELIIEKQTKRFIEAQKEEKH